MIQTHQHTRARPLHDRATTVSAADSTAAAPEPNSLPSQKRPPPANAPVDPGDGGFPIVLGGDFL